MVLERVKEMWTEVPKSSKCKSKPINNDHYISKVFLHGDQSPSLPVEPTHPGQGGPKSLPVLQSPVLSDANNSPVVFKRKKRCKERKLEGEEEEKEEKEEKEYIGLTKTKCGQHSLADDC